MRSPHAIFASACLLACLVQPAIAACPGQTDLERARCTQIRKDPAAQPGDDAARERRMRERERLERQRETRDAWRDGYRRGRYDSQPVIIVPRDAD
jgi:hypothetical protein